MSNVNKNGTGPDIDLDDPKGPFQIVNLTLSLDAEEIESIEYGNTVRWSGTVEGVEINLQLMAQDFANYSAGSHSLYENRLQQLEEAYEATRKEFEDMSYDEFMDQLEQDKEDDQ
tara:strand:+ start:192 stop:536 length:345 start_codon:yes stop_codon:yes gene_type:complete